MILSSPSSAEFAIISCWFRWFQHPEQDFHLKYSAMEIYSEYVKDLYSSKGYPLRLLGDPEGARVQWKFQFPLHSCSLAGSTSAMKVSNWGGHLHFREVRERCGYEGWLEASWVWVAGSGVDDVGWWLLGRRLMVVMSDGIESEKTRSGNLSGKEGFHDVDVDGSPLTEFPEAICSQYEENTCNRGGYCNFMHPKKVIEASFLVGTEEGIVIAAPKCGRRTKIVYGGVAATSQSLWEDKERRLIDIVVNISEEDANPTAASEGGDGTVVKCSFSVVALGPNLKS
ncbi:mediator of RNA polymerase II transcription subunit 15A-like protein [Tanacetum coccineum]|uniref:Mediator of RNA polymerase II transcription subunit 15A-like protein n=1 Tax=Tanacetum coccineum TaxID=301880 RepID=A0ABQ5CG09_9ASTR